MAGIRAQCCHRTLSSGRTWFMTLRPAAIWSTILLLVALTLVGSPARAAGAVTISIDPGTGAFVVDARAATTNLQVGWSGTEVSFQATTGIASWPTPACREEVNPVLGQYVFCSGAQVEKVVALFGSGGDLMRVAGVCIPYIGADLGGGNDDFENLVECVSPNVSQSEVAAGDGDDLVNVGNYDDTVTGGPGNDTLRTNGGKDSVAGGEGDDKIEAGAGNDTITGDAGNDEIFPAAGNDTADGGEGDDAFTSETWSVDSGADDLRGGPGIDLIDLIDHTTGVSVTLDDVANDGNSGEGDNYHSDIENLYGTRGADVLVGSNAPNYIRGSEANDIINGLGGDDKLDGDSGNDVIDGGLGNDTIYGGYDNDDVTGGAGKDALFGDYTSCSAYSCPGGADIVRARDGEVDAVNCGAGADQAVVDTADVVAADGFMVCESVDSATLPGTPGTPGAPGTGVTVGVKSASRAKGVKVSITCPTTCKATAKVTLSKKLKKKYRLKSNVIGSVTKSVKGTASVKITIKKWARQRLARKGVVKATIKVSIKGGSSLTKGIKLKP